MKKRTSGFIMIMALIVLTAISLMIGAFSMLVMYENQIAMRYVNSVKAYYLMRSGIEYGRSPSAASSSRNGSQNLTAEFSLTGSSGSVGTVKVTSDDRGTVNNPPVYTITVTTTARVGNVERTISCEEESDPQTRDMSMMQARIPKGPPYCIRNNILKWR